MTYTVITTFPKEDTQSTEKITVATRKETLFDQTRDQVLDLYDQYERSGYKIAVGFDSTDVEDQTPFETAHRLTESDIEYNAKLKFVNKSNQGTYDKIKELSQKIEQHGFYKYRVDVQLKIDDDSTVDVNRETTWFDVSDTVYKITPDVKSKNIDELQGLYTDLMDSGYLVDIDVKPKKSETTEFETNFNAFPDGTIVKFNLTDSEY